MRQSRYAGKKVLKKLKKHIDKEEKGRYTKQAVAVAGRRRGGEDLENCIEEKELRLLDRKVERRKRSQAIPVRESGRREINRAKLCESAVEDLNLRV